MIEVWKTLPSNNRYAVSNLGNVKSLEARIRFLDKCGAEHWRLKKEKPLASQLQNNGYVIAHLHRDNVRKARTVHSLVAEAFLGARAPEMVVCHLNGKRTDNRLSNLTYASQSENLKSMVRDGTCPFTAAKLTPDQVREIRFLEFLESAEDLAIAFKLKSSWQIHRIWRRENWKHL